ncbi:MAG: hypothetical protein HOE90_18070 [Bacteriovoracaceae bacterium]|jgi:hypothetical protein|nr:hypothetical protein [Bacteriovoracaceae bacterium]
MKVPVYHEIKMENKPIEEIEKLIKLSPVGSSPVYISFRDADDPEDVRRAVSKISLTITSMGVNPRFPNPIYVVYNGDYKKGELPHIRHVNELPKFFFSKTKEVTSKEMHFIKKIQLNVEKMSGSLIRKQLGILNKKSEANKELFLLTRETHYYQTLLKLLEEK